MENTKTFEESLLQIMRLQEIIAEYENNDKLKKSCSKNQYYHACMAWDTIKNEFEILKKIVRFYPLKLNVKGTLWAIGVDTEGSLYYKIGFNDKEKLHLNNLLFEKINVKDLVKNIKSRINDLNNELLDYLACD